MRIYHKRRSTSTEKLTNLLILNLVKYFTRPYYKRKYKILRKIHCICMRIVYALSYIINIHK